MFKLLTKIFQRSDAGHFPSTSWGAFLVQYSSSSKDPWPVQDIKIMHVLHGELGETILIHFDFSTS